MYHKVHACLFYAHGRPDEICQQADRIINRLILAKKQYAVDVVKRLVYYKNYRGKMMQMKSAWWGK